MSSPEESAEHFRLTVLGTTDTHGNILNWDYYSDSEYDDSQHNDIGLAKISTLINQIRAERGIGTTLTLDAGDTIQGTPLSYYYARIDPTAAIHPMAAAMNTIGYDAAALGNHEFNYGLDVLRRFESQLQYPLLGANALDWQTGEPAFAEFVIRELPIDGHAEPLKVGVVGLVTPGCAIWDKANLDGKLRFNGIVEQGKIVIPKVIEAGAEVVIVCCHSGADTSSSYGQALPWPENAASLLAEQVPGIDAILVGHAHLEIGQRFVAGPDGVKQVLLSEPRMWGQRLSVMELNLLRRQGRWTVDSASSTVLNANTVAEDSRIVELVASQHAATRAYVNEVIGSCTTAMSAATARFQDTAVLGFVNHIQASAVRDALTGSASAGLPVLSAVAPFNARAAIPDGKVTVRDVAGLYAFDNTLVAIRFTGAQLKAYLEHSARYYKQVAGTGPFRPVEITHAVTVTSPRGTADYNYDVVSGLQAPLTYEIDIFEPVGSRIRQLSYDGAPIPDDQQFVLALNNYRQSGGGNFPGVATAPIVYGAQVEIRQLIIDWVSANPAINPDDFATVHWKLVAQGRPVVLV